MLLVRTWIARRYSKSVIKTFLFGNDSQNDSGQESPVVELSSLTADGVNSILTEVLSKRGLNYSEPMQNLKMKFDVLQDVEKRFNLRIPSSQLNTLVNGQNIKDFLLFHQQKTARASKLFTIDMNSLPPNLSIKQPTLQVGPKKHTINDPSDPENYQHYS